MKNSDPEWGPFLLSEMFLFDLLDLHEFTAAFFPVSAPGLESFLYGVRIRGVLAKKVIPISFDAT